MNKGQRARKKTLRNKVVEHHVLYEYSGLTHKQEPITVYIFNNEHWLASQLQRRGKYVSKGFLQVLKQFILIREITGNFVDIGRTDLSASQTDTIKELDRRDVVADKQDKTGAECQPT